MYGDIDPEDAYDVDDPVDDRLAVLERAVPAIMAERDVDGPSTRNLTRGSWAKSVLARLQLLRGHPQLVDDLFDTLDGEGY